MNDEAFARRASYADRAELDSLAAGIHLEVVG